MDNSDYYILGKVGGTLLVGALLFAGFKRAPFWIVALIDTALAIALALTLTRGMAVAFFAFNLLWYCVGRLVRWGFDRATEG